MAKRRWLSEDDPIPEESNPYSTFWDDPEEDIQDQDEIEEGLAIPYGYQVDY